MSKNMVVFGNIAVVAVISVVLVAIRTGQMAIPEDLAKRGLSTLRRENIIFFGLVMPTAVGMVSYYVYNKWFLGRPLSFLYLAVGIGAALSVLAAIFYKRAFYDFTFLHIVHITCFGYIMPLLLK